MNLMCLIRQTSGTLHLRLLLPNFSESLPSPFAVGIYLPLSTMTPIYVGGIDRQFIEKSSGKNEELKTERKEKGILLGSGFIAGEGIAMVIIAVYAYIIKAKPKGIGFIWSGNVREFIALAAFSALVAYLIKKSLN